MMNVLQVQDDLKNFSQDQLISEMQQPSGNAPQFLVLSELNRRKRVKGDFEARQASTQQTVAQDAVASAGVPQQGMMGMSEAMAPQSAVSDSAGASAPMKMASGGLAQFGNEIRAGMGQEIDPYLDGVQQEAESKFKIDLNQNQSGNTMQLPGLTDRGGMRHRVRPAIAYPYQTHRGGKGLPRPAVMPSDDSTVFEGVRAVPYGNQAKFTGENLSKSFAEGGVIRAADGLPEETSYGDDFLEYIKGIPSAMYDTGDAALEFLSPKIKGDLSEKSTDTGFESMMKGSGRNLNMLYEAPYDIAKFGTDLIAPAISGVSDFFTEPGNKKEVEAQENKDVAEENKAFIGDGNKEVETKPKLESTSTEEKPLTIEQELLKRQADLEKNKDSDKWMALAQAGLAIMSSDNPNLAGAIGEGGTAGLTAFGDSNKRYQEGLTDILNARSKMETARLSAVSKGRLTRSSAIQAINTYNTSISSKEKQIADLIEKASVYGEDVPANVTKQIDDLKASIADLTYQQSQLFGAGQIRPRPKVNVGKLPSKQKAS